METGTFNLHCPKCAKLLQVNRQIETSAQCGQCSASVLLDERCRRAFALALANGHRMEQISWKETHRNDAVALFLFIVFLSVAVLHVVNTIALLAAAFIAAIGIYGLFTAQDGVDLVRWGTAMTMLLIPLLLFFVLPRIEPALRRYFRRQVVYSPYFIVASGGLVIVEPLPEPMFFPWPSIVRWSFETADVQNNAEMQIEYATTGGNTSTVTFLGDEFGELYDILSARLGRTDG